MPSDKETLWMRRLQNGDDKALADILDRYEKPVLNFAYKYVHDVAQAEDIAQDVFVEVYRRRRAYKPTGKFSTWLFTIAAHRCLNAKRARRKQTELLDQSDPAQSSPEEIADVTELQQAVWNALSELPGNQRIALLLAKYEEMALEEIARVLETTEGAVKQLLHRAKAELREKLEPFH
jgi:RNA polymerase sigma-70 factor (ECF subfamily)